MDYRLLSDAEIEQLEARGCEAQSWEDVAVAEGFDPRSLRNVKFFGKVSLGVFGEDVDCGDGFMRPSGIENAVLNNVSVGDNTLICNVGCHISNYDIGSGCYICNVGTMETTAGATFGEGSVISVLNEAGDGNIMLYRDLTAQIAWLMVHYDSDKDFVNALRRMIREEVEFYKPSRGTVGDGAKIVNTQEIVNVIVGDSCEISGAQRLTECSFMSTPDASVFIGNGVVCENSIVTDGSSITNGATLRDCFVGEACQVGEGFTASQCAVFVNSQLFCGEACAAFCGPFTVSHHKSTLLIGIETSFYNAGSATNFSNHAYKMGPLHYGTLMRGCKTASGAHSLLPIRIPAFSMLMGKIAGNPRTLKFPFSYYFGDGKETRVLPGRSLASAGLYRDVMKWPKRDLRPMSSRKSLVSYEWLSPYIGAQIYLGYSHLDTMIWANECVKKDVGEKAFAQANKDYDYNGAILNVDTIEKGRDYYKIAWDMFLGKVVADRRKSGKTLDAPAEPYDSEIEWCDMMGVSVPKSEVEKFVSEVKEGTIDTLEELKRSLQVIYDNSDEYCWRWAYEQLLREESLRKTNGRTVSACTSLSEADADDIEAAGQEAHSKWLKLIADDAEKEYCYRDVDKKVLDDFLETLR